MNDDLKVIIGIVLVAVLVVVASVALGVVMAVSCDDRWGEMQHEWSFCGGCRVLTEDGYVPESNLRIQFDGTKVIVNE